MNRRIGALALASATLAAWLVSTSACSGGGGDAPARSGNADAPSNDGGDTDPTTPLDTAADAPEGTPSASPFDSATPDASTDAPDVPIDASDAPGTMPETDGNAPPDATSATDDGPELQRPIGDGSDTTAIAGLWDYSRMTDAGTDVVLFAIDATGNVTEYDDQNDAVGNGAACHVVRRSSIASRGRDRYDIEDSSTLPGAASIDDVIITADDAAITFRYLGSASDPQFGGSQTGVEESYPAATGRNVDELAVCES